MLKIKSFTFNPFSENTYIVSDSKGECAVIDPGCMTREEQSVLASYLNAEKLNLRMVLNTHCHIDHVFGNHWVTKNYAVPLYASSKDSFNLTGSETYAQMTGLPFDPSPQPDHDLIEGEIINVGEIRFEILFTPGHAPGHVSFYHRESKILFSGDVLFSGSIGRTDLPGGNYNTLMQSIDKKLLTLSDDTKVYSGHGPMTTIGAERKNNPFILEYQQHRV